MLDHSGAKWSWVRIAQNREEHLWFKIFFRIIFNLISNNLCWMFKTFCGVLDFSKKVNDQTSQIRLLKSAAKIFRDVIFASVVPDVGGTIESCFSLPSFASSCRSLRCLLLSYRSHVKLYFGFLITESVKHTTSPLNLLFDFCVKERK